MLTRVLEAEQIQQKVAGFEARRGPLEGLKEIAEDPDYLAEWQAQSEQRPEPSTPGRSKDLHASESGLDSFRARPSGSTSSSPMETINSMEPPIRWVDDEADEGAIGK